MSGANDSGGMGDHEWFRRQFHSASVKWLRYEIVFSNEQQVSGRGVPHSDVPTHQAADFRQLRFCLRIADEYSTVLDSIAYARKRK